MKNKRAVLGERNQPREVLLIGAADPGKQQELLRTMNTVYQRLKLDQSSMRARLTYRDEPPSCTSKDEIKSAGMADISIALLTPTASVAVISAIASAVAGSRKPELRVYHREEEIDGIKGEEFKDAVKVERLAAEMTRPDVELRLRVG